VPHNESSAARAGARARRRDRSKKSPGPGQTIGEIVRAIGELATRRSTRTVSKALAAACGHLLPQALPPLIPAALLAEWKRKYRPSTVWTYRNELRHLMAALAQFGAPHISLPRSPRPKARAVTASPEELARLFKAPPPWLQLFQLLYFQCGLRLSETLRVTPRSWDREQHTVTLQVKGGHVRTAQITGEIETLFASASNPDADEPFIFALRGRRLTPRGVEAAWQTHRHRAGVNPALTPHDLRRTAASIVQAATHDIRAVQALLGHQSLTSSLAYIAPLDPAEVRKHQELLRFERFHSEVKQ